MKWFLIASACLLCSATGARGDAAADLYNQGVTDLKNQQYDAAGQIFDKFIASYPTSPSIDDARIRAGLSYLYAGKFAEAVDRLKLDAGDKSKPDYRATALYFTALAQFSLGQKSTTKMQGDSAYRQAETTLTALVGLVTAAPTPDNRGYLEQAIYYRALAQFLREDYAAAEKDLLQLLQQFSTSLSRPDYYLRLGGVYEEETNQAVNFNNDPKNKVKKTAAEIGALADKALATFDQVSRDPNALVQANDANMSKADILFMTAQIDPTPAGYEKYEKALAAYRLVRRKQDMIPLQQNRLDELRKKAQAVSQSSLVSLSNDISLLLGREEARLDELKSGPDPIIQALIRMAECYVSLKQPDEARTILHRLVAHAPLTADQQQEIDFQILYSYVLGGQTAQADMALTGYLGKHAGDPLADSISYQIAAKLLDRKNYTGALAQAVRSLHDFPRGKYAANALALQAQALTQLGRIAEADKVVVDFLAANPTSPVANQMFLTKAQGEADRHNYPAALADYQKVKDNPSAGAELQAAATEGYIQTLLSLKRLDEVISEAQAFEAKYSSSKALPGVLLFAGEALDQKHDPGAAAALQAIARKFPKDETAPYALYYVVMVYQEAANGPAMIRAATDLRQAYPQSYPLILQADEMLKASLIKQKKFDDAVALYQPLTQADKPDVAAGARNQIGNVWLAAAQALGHYQSMPLDTREEAKKRLDTAEQTFLGTLKDFPDQIGPVGDAFDGLVGAAKQRRSWGLLKEADLEGYLGKLGADLTTTPDMQARFELAKAGLVFVYKDGAKQYPAALDRMKKTIDANPGLRLTPQETDQFGELLLAARDYTAALKVYGDLLAGAGPNEQVAQGDAYYGLGATYLGQGNLAQAKISFTKLTHLPNGGRWHPHILDAVYGIAFADEQSGQESELSAALQTYASLMTSPQGGVALQAKAMLGYGRLLEKQGNVLQPTAQGPTEYAVHYYQEPHTLFGSAVPALSAEGLFDAGQAYEKAGDKANAKKQYDDLLNAYRATAPDWAAKAQAAEAQLGA